MTKSFTNVSQRMDRVAFTREIPHHMARIHAAGAIAVESARSPIIGSFCEAASRTSVFYAEAL